LRARKELVHTTAVKGKQRKAKKEKGLRGQGGPVLKPKRKVSPGAKKTYKALRESIARRI